MESVELHDLKVTETQPTSTSTNTSKTKKIITIVGTTFVVIAIAVGLVTGLLYNNANSTPATETSAENSIGRKTQGNSDALEHQIVIYNNCSFPVWVGVLGDTRYPLPMNGGWKMDKHTNTSVSFAKGWVGRFWGRTNCNHDGWCQTGDCGGKIQCNGAGGNPPVSLAEFAFDTPGGDYYDVSLVDGYNLPMQIRPKNATRSPFSGDWRYHCQWAGCLPGRDLNQHCPHDLQVKNSSGTIVACLSACMKFNKDEFCCRGRYGTPEHCPPTNYTRTFKDSCPDAYSYAYDDNSALYTCDGKPISNYDVVFCP